MRFYFLFLLLLFPYLIQGQSASYQFTKIFDNVGSWQLNGALDNEIDEDGNTYIVGFFSGSTDVDPSANSEVLVCSVGIGMYLTKFDPNGNLLWAKSWIPGTATSRIWGYSMGVDSSNNILLTGSFTESVDMDPNAGVQNATTVNGNSGVYVLKLDSNGNYIWHKRMASTGLSGSDCSGKALKIGSQNKIYITGDFQLTVDFDPNAGVNNLTSFSTTDKDAFVLALDSLGNFQWANGFGGNADDAGLAVALDQDEQVVVTGKFAQSCDFNTGTGVFNVNSNGLTDVFISKFNVNGTWLWTKTTGGNLDDDGSTVLIDENNFIYVGGTFQNTMDINTDAATQNITALGVGDQFILKLSNLGGFVWGKQIGGLNDDRLICGAVNSSQEFVFAGMTSFDLDIDPTGGTTIINSTKTDAGTMVILDSLGNLLDYHYLVGNYSYMNAIASRNDQLVAVGYYEATCNFDPTGINTTFTVGTGDRESYFIKFNQCVPTRDIQTISACGSYLVPNTSDIVSNSDTLIYNYLDINGCDSIKEYRITIFDLPNVQANCDDTSVCEGNEILLFGMGAQNYTWNNNITDNITFIPSSDLTCVVTGTDTNGCTNSDTLEIVFYPQPIIDLGADVQTSQTNYTIDAGIGWSTYLWNTAETSQTITISQSGNYSVTITDNNGCSNSDTIAIDFLAGLSAFENDMVAVFSNPTLNQISIKTAFEMHNAILLVYSMDGKMVLNVKDIYGDHWTSGNIANFAPGIYLVELYDNSDIYTLKIRIN